MRSVTCAPTSSSASASLRRLGEFERVANNLRGLKAINEITTGRRYVNRVRSGITEAGTEALKNHS